MSIGKLTKVPNAFSVKGAIYVEINVCYAVAIMAISFARLNIHKRSEGHSAVAASAYRSGTRLLDERTGEIHDYTKRQDVCHSEILLPDNACALFLDREKLWNTAESVENRKDAQIAKEMTLALPKELALSHQIALAKRFAHEHFVQHGLATELAIHDKQDGNPHAHLLITMRRIEQDQFSKKKARDLNPVFYGKTNKQVFDIWHEKWRDCQNAYFREHKIDLEVDEHYLIATTHQGRFRSITEPYKKALTLLSKQAAYLHCTPDIVLDTVSHRKAQFTERDIAKIISKNTIDNAQFQKVFIKTKASKRLISIGTNERSQSLYTTKEILEQEHKMLRQTAALSGRKQKTLQEQKIKALKHSFNLQEEQAKAVNFILSQGDIACVVGRAGAGKTYTMKAVHDIYVNKDYQLYGAALSGIAAKTLQAQTGIKSDTIYSLTKRIEKGKFQPKPNSILVIDEAGMLGLKAMANIIDYAKKAKCKVLLIGDPDQLQPIDAGTPFRSILEQTGFAELQNIQRQIDPKDREASQNLAQGKIDLAIKHYQKQGKFTITDPDNAKSQLISAWQKTLKDGIENQIILAHSKTQTRTLNLMAREKLIEQKLLGAETFKVKAATDTINLSKGDRIVFLKNNYDLKVYNGDFATIDSIQGKHITARLKEKTITFNIKDYNDFSHGYAVTVHKSQGSTFKNAYVYIDGNHWDRHLLYVAMTRHKKQIKAVSTKNKCIIDKFQAKTTSKLEQNHTSINRKYKCQLSLS